MHLNFPLILIPWEPSISTSKFLLTCLTVLQLFVYPYVKQFHCIINFSYRVFENFRIFFFKSDVPFYSLFLYRMFKLGFYVLEHSKHSFYSLYLINPIPEASIYLFPLSVVSADHGLWCFIPCVLSNPLLCTGHCE